MLNCVNVIIFVHVAVMVCVSVSLFSHVASMDCVNVSLFFSCGWQGLCQCHPVHVAISVCVSDMESKYQPGK